MIIKNVYMFIVHIKDGWTKLSVADASCLKKNLLLFWQLGKEDIDYLPSCTLLFQLLD